MKHLSKEQLEALVMGLASGGDGAIRQHLASCEECARRLAREAQLEWDLYDAAGIVAEDVEVVRARYVPARSWRVALAVSAAVAVLAFGAWFLVPREPPGVVLAPVRVTGTPLARTPCVEDPTRLGPGACVLPPQDVCRFVTVERRRDPSY